MIVLGIETSCDETAIGIVNSNKQILANVVYSQISTHAKFGGVVPEVASREHLRVINVLIKQALQQANLNYNQIDAFASTIGPGLVGALLIGTLSAKTLAVLNNKPFIGVNHLQGHALMPMLENNNIKFPFLLLLVSGGHTQFVAVLNYNKFVTLGTTIDDAVGEAFDKSARMLGFSYPGGQLIEQHAKLGQPIYKLPLPLYYAKNCNFSFSGLKTAVKNLIEQTQLTPQNINNICSSLQTTIAKILLKKSHNAIQIFKQQYGVNPQLVISGGVSANKFINTYLSQNLQNVNVNVFYPSLQYATDNGTMIAWAGLLNFSHNQTTPLDFAVMPRFNLQDVK